jgi:hypothetical protein
MLKLPTQAVQATAVQRPTPPQAAPAHAAPQTTHQAPPQAGPPRTGLFVGSGLKNASVTVRSAKLTEGRYVVRVTGAAWKTVRMPAGSKKFFLEFVVVQSNRPDVIQRLENESAADYDARCAKAPTPVGTSASWGQSCADMDVGFGALKGFVAAITGSNPEDPAFIDLVEPLLDQIIGDNALKGSLLPVETLATVTKNGFPFVRHTWGLEITEPEAST